jgi:Mrp family chromosome partitioning ATPase
MDFVYSGSDSLTLSRLKQPSAASGSLVNAPNFWTSLRKEFVLTVVDSLPASKGVDGIMLSASMDGVVVVIAAESTRAPIVMSLLERLQGQGAPVLGAVLNKRKFYIPHLIYRWLDRL